MAPRIYESPVRRKLCGLILADQNVDMQYGSVSPLPVTSVFEFCFSNPLNQPDDKVVRPFTAESGRRELNLLSGYHRWSYRRDVNVSRLPELLAALAHLSEQTEAA